ncbi:hypothetical protein BDEG_24095 [Batrachochytrium dendrobatidis JEL423]|uniref:Uncharacterized protein n=1 Tax=Batrachochytrium dendrobatidis (strain JEL423) TaxID=403673 RepID=A0A177WLM3_BATDL|nr:hypothetical protein BDEG_24095 [Batrachochytrium dendrobatidis JEL423]
MNNQLDENTNNVGLYKVNYIMRNEERSMDMLLSTGRKRRNEIRVDIQSNVLLHAATSKPLHGKVQDHISKNYLLYGAMFGVATILGSFLCSQIKETEVKLRADIGEIKTADSVHRQSQDEQGEA